MQEVEYKGGKKEHLWHDDLNARMEKYFASADKIARPAQLPWNS